MTRKLTYDLNLLRSWAKQKPGLLARWGMEPAIKHSVTELLKEYGEVLEENEQLREKNSQLKTIIKNNIMGIEAQEFSRNTWPVLSVAAGFGVAYWVFGLFLEFLRKS